MLPKLKPSMVDKVRPGAANSKEAVASAVALSCAMAIEGEMVMEFVLYDNFSRRWVTFKERFYVAGH